MRSYLENNDKILKLVQNSYCFSKNCKESLNVLLETGNEHRLFLLLNTPRVAFLSCLCIVVV